MKLILGLFLAAVSLFFFVDSASLRLPQQAVSISKNVGDIWSNCSKPGDELKLIKVEFIPDPPVPGKPVTVNVEYNLDENVTNGTIAVKAKFGIFTIINKTYPLCTEIKNLNRTCPVDSVKDGKISITESLPTAPVHGTVKANVVVKDQSAKELACLNIELKI